MTYKNRVKLINKVLLSLGALIIILYIANLRTQWLSKEIFLASAGAVWLPLFMAALVHDAARSASGDEVVLIENPAENFIFITTRAYPEGEVYLTTELTRRNFSQPTVRKITLNFSGPRKISVERTKNLKATHPPGGGPVGSLSIGQATFGYVKETERISLGILPKGNYSVQIIGQDDHFKVTKLEIRGQESE